MFQMKVEREYFQQKNAIFSIRTPKQFVFNDFLSYQDRTPNGSEKLTTFDMRDRFIPENEIFVQMHLIRYHCFINQKINLQV